MGFLHSLKCCLSGLVLCCLWQSVGAQTADVQDLHYKALITKLRIAQESGSQELQAQCQLNLGGFYVAHGVFSEALQHYAAASKLLEGSKPSLLHIQWRNALGKVAFEQQNFTNAKTSFEAAVKLAVQLKDTTAEAVSRNLLGGCLEKLGVYKNALEQQFKALSLFAALEDVAKLAMVNEAIGSIYEDLESYDTAKTYFSKAYQYLQASGTVAEVNLLNNLGDVDRKSGRYQSALQFTTKALVLADQLNHLKQLKSAHKDLSRTYALMGHTQKALEQLKLAMQYNDQWLLQQNTDQLNTFWAIYENNKKEHKISLLQQQQSLSDSRQNLYVLAIVFIVLISVLLLWYQQRKRKAALHLSLMEERALKAELNQKVAQENNLKREIQLKAAALTRYSVHLSQKNKTLQELSLKLHHMATRRHMDLAAKLKQLSKDIKEGLKLEADQDEFIVFFKEIHPEFIAKLNALALGKLSGAEMRLAMLLRLNMTSKEIAAVLRVTPDSVRVARYRLRKKLPIGPKQEIIHFMLGL